MKYIKKIIISLLLFNNQFCFSGEKEDIPKCLYQFKTAIELCDQHPNDIGFIAAKTAIEKYQENLPEIIIFLKERMCSCFNVQREYQKDLIEAADCVIKDSDRSIFIGLAWLQKGLDVYINREDEKAVTYFKIALYNFENHKKGSEASKVDGYEYICHNCLSKCYKTLEKHEEYESEIQILNMYIQNNH